MQSIEVIRIVRAALAGLLLALTVAWPSLAAAQAWPARTMRMIVPGAPGTSPDILARTIAQYLTPRLGQQIVIVNQPGGGGNIGHAPQPRRRPTVTPCW